MAAASSRSVTPARTSCGPDRCIRLRTLDPRRDREPERRALSRTRLDPDAAPMPLDNLPGDRQAQACPMLGAGAGLVHLLEGFKNAWLILGGNPGSRVANDEGEHVVRRGDVDAYLAHVGEGDGISD